MIRSDRLDYSKIQFIDRVITVTSDKIRATLSPHDKKSIWILDLENSDIKVIVLPELLKNKQFLTNLLANEVISKRYAFTIRKLGRYLIDIKEIGD